tara:strand:+ start:323 stop:595 length:273 start_codon:yes stop_codon:yes gene_type:complete
MQTTDLLIFLSSAAVGLALAYFAWNRICCARNVARLAAKKARAECVDELLEHAKRFHTNARLQRDRGWNDVAQNLERKALHFRQAAERLE